MCHHLGAPPTGKLIPAHPLEPPGQAALASSMWEPRRAVQAMLTLGALIHRLRGVLISVRESGAGLNHCLESSCRERIPGWAKLG